MAIKNLSVQNFGLILKKQYGHHSQLFQSHTGAVNLEILQVASSNLHKRYMAVKASLIVILAQFQKQNDCHITCLMSKKVILLKRPYISLTIVPRGSECENNL